MASKRVTRVAPYTASVVSRGQWITTTVTDSGDGARISVATEGDSPGAVLRVELGMPLSPLEIYELKRTVDALAERYPFAGE